MRSRDLSFSFVMYLVFILTLSLHLAGCAHKRPHLQRPGDLRTIVRKLHDIGGLKGNGWITAEVRGERLGAPFEVAIAGDGRIELTLHPGTNSLLWREFSLKSTQERTTVVTPDSEFEVKIANISPRGLYAFLLSIAGGDMIVRWLDSAGCALAGVIVCDGLEFEVRVDPSTSSVSSWTIHDEKGAELNAIIYRYSMSPIPMPRIISATVQPYDVIFGVRYEKIELYRP